MDSYKKILLFVVLSLINYSLNERCSTYKCSDLQGDICLKSIYNETTKIEAKNCQDKTKVCPIQNFGSNSEMKCQDKISLSIRQYPGGPCLTKDDCINSSECKTNICQGFEENLPCERHDQCFYGYACYRKTPTDNTVCNKLRDLNENGCSSEFECQMYQGCFNGKCVDYYSLVDGTDLGKNKYENSYSLCASGHDRHGICDSMKNVNKNQTVSDELIQCDESNPCRYVGFNGTIVEMEACKCGKNPDSTRYCPIYGGNKNFRNSVKILKKLIKENKDKCNTIERNKICLAHIPNLENSNAIQTLQTVKTKLNSYHEFANSEDCIKKIFYPFYNKDLDKDPDEPSDLNKKCPIFKCNSDNNSKNQVCANHHFEMQTNITFVDLFSNSCDWEKQKCQYDTSYSEKEEKKFTCINKSTDSIGKKYPGEACSNDNDCFVLNGVPVEGVGKCVNNKCTGFNLDQNCFHSTQCLAGLYCKENSVNNSTATTCQSQEKANADCKSTYDCLNNLICYNNKCSNIFYSLIPGEKVYYKNFTGNIDIGFAHKSCANGMAKFINEEYGVCIVKKNSDNTDADKGNLVPCVPDQKCNYTLTDNKDFNDTATEDCECGFNLSGQGYCPAGHNISNF